MLTNARAYVLWTAGVIVVKWRFIPSQVDSSKGNFEHMTSFFVNNFPAGAITHQYATIQFTNVPPTSYAVLDQLIHMKQWKKRKRDRPVFFCALGKTLFKGRKRQKIRRSGIGCRPW